MTQNIYTDVSKYTAEMEQHSEKHPVCVSGILQHLGVSRSGYYAWKKCVPPAAQRYRGKIKEDIRQIYADFHKNYGTPKITQELFKKGRHISEKTVGNYIRQVGLRAQWVKPYIQTTVQPDFRASLKNIPGEQFSPERPDAVWVSDITYIWTLDGFVYLTSIMDLYSRKIIAWKLSTTLEAVHVADCVKKAKQNRRIKHPLLIHTDRGSQYVSKIFLEETKDMTNSYSRKAYPWDNACIESFHALIEYSGAFSITSPAIGNHHSG